MGAVPPLVTAALNVTVEPAHTAPDGLAEIVMAGVAIGYTTIVMPVLRAESIVVQRRLLKIIQFITSPFAGV